MRTQPSGETGTKSGSSPGRGAIDREFGIAGQECPDDLLAFLAARASRPSRRARRRASAIAPRGRAACACSSALSAIDPRPGAIEDFRDGGGTCRSPSRARRAGSRRIGGRASTSARRLRPAAPRDACAARFSRSRARRLADASSAVTSMTRRGELHRLAAGRSAEVEHLPGVGRDQARRQAKRQDPEPTSGRRRSPEARRPTSFAAERDWARARCRHVRPA